MGDRAERVDNTFNRATGRHCERANSEEHLNGLANASSSYLRSAMHQPVDWQEWGDAAFARAKSENKPVLLDIGAVWCHWCHVMDRESYEDPEIAEIINGHFIAVKVDRDERLDVDSRYQAAVQAMSGQGGWPLTVILTPEGKPFFGGTYFPKDERYGRPGFGHVLLTMAHAYHRSPRRSDRVCRQRCGGDRIQRIIFRPFRRLACRNRRQAGAVGAAAVRQVQRRVWNATEISASVHPGFIA